MYCSTVTAPHLRTDTNASLAIRVLVETRNSLRRFLMDDDSTTVTVEQQLQLLRDPARTLLAVAENPGEIYSQDDEFDPKFWAFAVLNSTETCVNMKILFCNRFDGYSAEVLEMLIAAARAHLAQEVAAAAAADPTGTKPAKQLVINYALALGRLEESRCCADLRRMGFELLALTAPYLKYSYTISHWRDPESSRPDSQLPNQASSQPRRQDLSWLNL